jgi:hypothetical protein
VRVPIKFFWSQSGFQGIEMDFSEELMEWEQEFVQKVARIFTRPE